MLCPSKYQTQDLPGAAEFQVPLPSMRQINEGSTLSTQQNAVFTIFPGWKLAWGFAHWLANVERKSAAGPVSRILSAGKLRCGRIRNGDHVPQDGHSSGPHITVRLKRPTRRLITHRAGTRPAGSVSLLRLRSDPPNQRNSLPIWSCSVWGLPCPPHYWSGGALLPHLFTLACGVAVKGGIFSVALSVSRP